MARPRRTPEQARREILAVAAERLAAHGVAGLGISDIARQAGMSHATLLHHFGSAAAMQSALAAQMTRELLAEILTALDHPEATTPAAICTRLFAVLRQGGHANLVAWRAVTNLPVDADAAFENRDLFESLVETLASRLDVDRTSARYLVLLVATAALGFAITQPVLPGLVGLDPAQAEAFPAWLEEGLGAMARQRAAEQS